MGWTVTESAKGHVYQADSPPGEFSMTMYFDVLWDGTGTYGTGANEDSDMLNAIAYVRQRVPVGYQYNTLFKSLIAREVTAQQIEESQGCWRVAVRYSTREGFYGDGVFCMVTRSTQVRQAAQYRKATGGFGWSPTSDGANGSGDIGLDKVDINGQPRTYEVPQTLVTIDTYWDRTYNAQGEPPYASYTALVNKRNNAVFIGYPIGSVRYLGFQSAPVDNYYRLQHTFLFDAWLHAEQIPIPNPTGQPILVAGATLGGYATLQVGGVIQYQKYATGDLSSILSANQLSELTTPLPAFPP